MQNIDLLYTDKITFNGNNVKSLYLNNSKIWGGPIQRQFATINSQSVDVSYSSGLISYQVQCKTYPSPLRTDKPVAVKFGVDDDDVTVELGRTESLGNSVEIGLDDVRLVSGTNTFEVVFRARKLSFFGTKSVSVLALYFKYPEV